MPGDLLDQLAQLAERDNRSVSAYVEKVLTEHVAAAPLSAKRPKRE